MIPPESFLSALQKHEIEFYAGVPDSLLKEFLTVLSCNAQHDRHFTCANEGNAIALAAGFHMATGKIPLVYMQNSGLGNAVNPLMSLCHQDVYSIPMLILVGWRGEPGDKDEPQHMPMGGITSDLLAHLKIDHKIIEAGSNVEALLSESIANARAHNAPVALLCRKNTFSKAESKKRVDANSKLSLTRHRAVALIIESADYHDVLVCNTGFTGREVFGQREQKNQSHDSDFLNAGAMGHSSQIALGLAVGNPSQKVICLDGDGAIIMHLGGLALIGPRKPRNLTHILLNNGVHDSVGGQPTAGFEIDLQAIAKACGYPVVETAETAEQLKQALSRHLHGSELSFLEIRICPGSSDNLPRPPQDFRKQKSDFMNFAASNSGKQE